MYAGLVPSISEAGKEGERIFVPSFALHHERGDEAESVLEQEAVKKAFHIQPHRNSETNILCITNLETNRTK